MTNFGVRSFLEKFLELSPQPQPRILQNGEILDPSTEEFSAFVFKIQANMNPAHRDRIAFMRICSGVFEKGCLFITNREEKWLNFHSHSSFWLRKELS